MKFASIDIGTNTLRLLIAEKAQTSHGMRPLGYKRVITRLGGGFSEVDGIDPEAAERTLCALEDFRAEVDKAGVDHMTAVGTSVLRRAKNRDWFVEEAKKRANIDINVISGGEEAGLSFFGVMFVLADKGLQDKERLILDIGGGSTEFIASKGLEIKSMWSSEIGVVHLAEKHLRSDPPSTDELSAMDKEIEAAVEDLMAEMNKAGMDPENYSADNGVDIVGTAGTITTLAAISQRLKTYNPKLINNYVITIEKLKELDGSLKSVSAKERLEMPGLEAGREDLILAGSSIVLSVMQGFGFRSMKVSDGGLLEGVLLKDIWEHGSGSAVS